MKSKKAAKRLGRVEALLSGVLNGYATDVAEVREPLEAAAAAVKRAKSALESSQPRGSEQSGSTAGGTAATSERVTPAARKKTSHATTKNRVTKKKLTKSNAKSGQPQKRISAEGIKRIIEANRRRWAKHRAGRTAVKKIPARG